MIGRTVAIIALLCVVAVQATALPGDEKCPGKCQDTKVSCSGGSYVSGLCGGAATRRCCVPTKKLASAPATKPAPSKPQPAQPVKPAPQVVPVPQPRPQQPAPAAPVCGGTCQANNLPCGAAYEKGKCKGAANIQCCPKPAAVPVPQPRPQQPTPAAPVCGGKCQANNLPCGAAYEAGKCPGAANVQCCPKPITAASTTPRPQQPPAAPVCGGKCQANNLPCGAAYEAGKCPGAANVQCCPKPVAGGASAPAPVAPGAAVWPKFSAVWKAYPHGEAKDVKRRIGGKINAEWITNTCTVRVARALTQADPNYVIKPMTLADGKQMLLVPGADGKGLPVRVREFSQWVNKRYGKPSIRVVNPGDGTEEIPQQFLGKKGLIKFDVRIWDDATGHFDLWDGEACAHNCYFDKAREVWLWEIA